MEDGASSAAKSGQWYSHKGGWVTWWCQNGWYGTGNIGSLGCSQRLGTTKWFCMIYNSAWNGATAANVMYWESAHNNTIGKTIITVTNIVKEIMGNFWITESRAIRSP